MAELEEIVTLSMSGPRPHPSEARDPPCRNHNEALAKDTARPPGTPRRLPSAPAAAGQRQECVHCVASTWRAWGGLRRTRDCGSRADLKPVVALTTGAAAQRFCDFGQRMSSFAVDSDKTLDDRCRHLPSELRTTGAARVRQAVCLAARHTSRHAV